MVSGMVCLRSVRIHPFVSINFVEFLFYYLLKYQRKIEAISVIDAPTRQHRFRAFLDFVQLRRSFVFGIQKLIFSNFLIFSESKKRRKDPSESTTEEDNGAPECKGKRKKNLF